MAGLTAVFIFAVQMLNFPVAAGTSGHLLGGALAAILVGPWVALLAMTVVLSLQAFIFADGGLSAIGLNILNMGVITVLIGWFLFKFILKILPKKN
jgi:cobalamin biosynthesis protein CbiM